MLATFSFIAAMVVLFGYIKLGQKKGKEYPLASKEGRFGLLIIIFLTLLVVATGAWSALEVGQTRREQYTLLLIVLAGPIAGGIGLGVLFLQKRITNRTNKSKHQ